MRPGERTLTTRPRPARHPRAKADWAALDDEALLELRLCDLDLQIEGSILEPRINRLYEDLQRKGITFRPHFWLSSEWFAPDGVTMYFSSTRPGGEGYYDIWYTVMDDVAVEAESLGKVKASFR